MPRNTFLFILALAAFAAVVVGINIGRRRPQPEQQTAVSVSPTEAPDRTLLYESPGCGVSFRYPEALTKIEAEGGGAMMVNNANPGESIAIACQDDIPRPALVSERIEQKTFGSVSATLYHDASPKDGTPVDRLIFRHPKTSKDVYIASYGEPMEVILRSLEVL